jgi:hypothetical protein
MGHLLLAGAKGAEAEELAEGCRQLRQAGEYRDRTERLRVAAQIVYTGVSEWGDFRRAWGCAWK